MVHERPYRELTASGVTLQCIDDDGGADPGSADLVDNAICAKRLPARDTARLSACWWMLPERDRQVVRLCREGHLRDMAGVLRGTLGTFTVAKGTLATSPPDEHVARGTFRTLTVARGTFATSPPSRRAPSRHAHTSRDIRQQALTPPRTGLIVRLGASTVSAGGPLGDPVATPGGRLWVYQVDTGAVSGRWLAGGVGHAVATR